jgi:outer membrane protein OmpA-like peptidoglycan-associated protein
MESEVKKSIDELFRSKLKDFEYPSQDSNWPLMNHLVKEKQSNRKIFFFSFGSLTVTFAAIAATVSLAGLGIYFGLNYSSESQNLLPKQIVKNEIKENSNLVNPIKNRNLDSDESASPSEQHQFNSKDGTVDRLEFAGLPHGSIGSVNLDGSSKPSRSESKKYIESTSTDQFIKRTQKKSSLTINNIGEHINSSFADYGPVINANGSVLYFTSRRPISEKEKRKNKNASEKIYSTSFDSKLNKWTDAMLLPSPINKPNRFTSVVGLSKDGKRMLLYSDDRYGNGNLYESVLDGKTWQIPELLPAPINSDHFESSACYSPDGQTIYFVSDRPGGQGSLDIWYAKKNKQGRWGEAQNIGALVNTPEKEEGVFMHPDGKILYFSSRGHGGKGGYDIFYTELENGRWSLPKSLGEEVNSAADDVYFVMEANGKVGYFSSFREGGAGEKDIFRIEFGNKEIEKEKVPLSTLLKGKVIDKDNNKPLNAEIVIVDLDKNKPLTTLHSNNSSGSFSYSLLAGKNYQITVKTQGYLFYSENLEIPKDDSYIEINKIVMLEKLTKGSNIVLKIIFYDFDKASLLEASKEELNHLLDMLEKNSNLKVELSSHTDSRGSDSYNLKLSQERAQSCLDYLIEKGIHKSRIVAKGYGEKELLNSDEKINKTPSKEDQEQLHLENRRTEIKILENNTNK